MHIQQFLTQFLILFVKNGRLASPQNMTVSAAVSCPQ